jgi:ABC-type cobalamin/Fe3+-siderophores transport system ATPase subunit
MLAQVGSRKRRQSSVVTRRALAREGAAPVEEPAVVEDHRLALAHERKETRLDRDARVVPVSGLARDHLGRHPHRPLLGKAGPADLQAVDAALTMTDLLPLASRSIRSLSTGEWQRSLLARALAQETPLLMLDEPAAHLDPGHGYDTHALLRKISREKDRSVLCVSHDLNLSAEFCDRLLLLSNGRLRALGTPAEVLQETLLQESFACSALRVTTNALTGNPNVVYAR